MDRLDLFIEKMNEKIRISEVKAIGLLNGGDIQGYLDTSATLIGLREATIIALETKRDELTQTEEQ